MPKPENPPAPPEHEPGCPQEGVIGSVECCKPAPRDERLDAKQEASRLRDGIVRTDKHGWCITNDVKVWAQALEALVILVCEQRDEARREAKVLRESASERGNNYDALEAERNSLKEQLAGAHAIWCRCHEERYCIQNIVDIGCNGTHPHVDPRCSWMRNCG